MWWQIIHSTFFNAGILFGLLFLLMGFFIHRYPPKSIRSWYGYRSFLSTRNIEMWHAANEYAAYTSKRIGAILILVGIACALIYDRQTDWFFYITVGAVVCGTMYIVGNTEWQLTQHFDKDGKRVRPDVDISL